MTETTDKKKDARKDIVSRQEEKKKVEAYQPVYQRKPQIANSETPQEVLQKILDVEVPNI